MSGSSGGTGTGGVTTGNTTGTCQKQISVSNSKELESYFEGLAFGLEFGKKKLGIEKMILSFICQICQFVRFCYLDSFPDDLFRESSLYY